MAYSGFKIPNEADAGTQASQAGLDALEVQALVGTFAETCVISGCAVTAQGSPNMTVAVAAGSVMVAGVLAQVGSGNVTVSAADATNPRIDLIVADNTGAKSCLAGTPAAASDSTHAGPVWSTSFDVTTYVLLAEVYVPANATTITTTKIVDKRLMWTRYGHGCRLYHSATQNVNDTTLTALAFDSELFDSDGLHDTSTNTTRITIPTGLDGLWLIGANVEFPALTGAVGSVLATIRLNGSHYLGENRSTLGTNNQFGASPAVLWKASAADYFEIVCYQTSGGTATFPARTSTHDEYAGFWAVYLGK